VIYGGTIAAHQLALPFDKHHWMETGRVFPVCGSTFRMLAGTVGPAATPAVSTTGGGC
jgi:hypothetical protein